MDGVDDLAGGHLSMDVILLAAIDADLESPGGLFPQLDHDLLGRDQAVAVVDGVDGDARVGALFLVVPTGAEAAGEREGEAHDERKDGHGLERAGAAHAGPLSVKPPKRGTINSI